MNMLRFSIGTGSFGSKEIWRMSVKKEIPACFSQESLYLGWVVPWKYIMVKALNVLIISILSN